MSVDGLRHPHRSRRGCEQARSVGRARIAGTGERWQEAERGHDSVGPRVDPYDRGSIGDPHRSVAGRDQSEQVHGFDSCHDAAARRVDP